MSIRLGLGCRKAHITIESLVNFMRKNSGLIVVDF